MGHFNAIAASSARQTRAVAACVCPPALARTSADGPAAWVNSAGATRWADIDMLIPRAVQADVTPACRSP
jgi:hypothetical protein